MKLFKSKKKYTKHYLRVFANIGVGNYSAQDRERITQNLINIAEMINHQFRLKYDIYGTGYGVSKGGPLLGQKSFDNRIKKKGFEKMSGLKVECEENTYNSGFNLMIYPEDSNKSYLDIYFSWAYSNNEQLKVVKDILMELAKSVKVNYSYSYPTDDSLFDMGEGYIKKGIFGETLSTPNSENVWQMNIVTIPTGTIKKLYPINMFNESQLELLKHITPSKKVKITESGEIWYFKEPEIHNDKVRSVL